MGTIIIELLFVILFAITISAFIIAINSKGSVRISLSFILATVLLIGSVYEVLNYTSKTRLNQQMKQVTSNAEAKEQESEELQAKNYEAFLKSIASRGKKSLNRIKNLDLADESIEMDVYFSRASSTKSKVRALLKELKTQKAPEDGFEQTRKTLEKALNKTMISAKYLNLYFRSNNEEEEETRASYFHSNANVASSLFRKVNDLASDRR